MIIVKVIGGLGNQLFQYALYSHLKIETNLTVKLDISSFSNYKLHSYGLDKIINKLDIANSDEINFLKRNKYIKEPQFNYWEEINNIEEGYLDGYWQSEKYFKKNQLELIDTISFESLLEENHFSLVDDLHNQNSVSIHVRRGDYVTNEIVNNIHGTCSINYYIEAIEYLKNNVRDPYFYIFSDDIEWVKKELRLPIEKSKIKIIHYNDANRNYVDLFLMSQCKHNIIANSTFSWWGAWLNENESKIVIAPKRWFRESNNDTSDIIPNTWVTF